MKVIYTVIFAGFLLLSCASAALSKNKNDSLLNELSHAIEHSEIYVRKKHEQIADLQKELKKGEGRSLTHQFSIYDKLYKEYRSYKYDSAFEYVLKLKEAARRLDDPDRVSYANLQLSFILLSSGMYKEAFDILEGIETNGLSSDLKISYYDLMSRAYYDLANYNMDTYYAKQYLERGSVYSDSAIALSDKASQQFLYLRGMKNLKEENFEESIKDFLLILEKFKPTSHNYAIVASTLAGAYSESGESVKAMDLMAKAAIADVRSSTKEAIALINLAGLLYESGDVERAYGFINKALEDADFYGARQRKVQASAILPIIEGAQMARVERQRSRLFVYAIVVSGLSLLVIAFTFVIFRQLKQLRSAKSAVTEANLNLQEANTKLNETIEVLNLTNNKLHVTNEMLQETNEKLLEANKIKEEYIGYSFNMYNEYIEKIDKIIKEIKRARNIRELNPTIEAINVERERESLYLNFDKVFLKLFPDFVTVFNSFFKEEDRIIPREDGSLEIELRIFALIRIGINDHEQIANMLEYSIRTIYNYKTKVKNKSMLSNEEFERKIMEIKAF